MSILFLTFKNVRDFIEEYVDNVMPRGRLIICANVIEILGQRPTGNNDINVEAEIAFRRTRKANDIQK